MDYIGALVVLTGLVIGSYVRKEITLDISDIDETHVVSTETSFSDSSLYSYEVIPGVSVSDIKYGETTVWKRASDGYEFIKAFLISSSSSPSIIHIILQNDEEVQRLLSLMLVNGKWVSLDVNAKTLLSSALGYLPLKAKSSDGEPTPGLNTSGQDVSTPEGPRDLQDYEFGLLFTFDISKTTHTHLFNVGRYKSSGLDLTIYNPKSTSEVVGIVDGDDVMWQRSDRHMECGNICLYSKNGRVLFADVIVNHYQTTYFVCFEKTVDGWEEISESEFRAKIIAISVKPFVFDISLGLSRESEARKTIAAHLNEERRDTINSPYIIYRPKNNTTVTGLVDGESRIWSRMSDDEECVDMVLHAKGGDFMAATIIVMSSADYNFFFYKKNGNAWIKINEQEYEDFLKILENGQLDIPKSGEIVAVPTLAEMSADAFDKTVTLDISNQEDSETIQVFDYTTSSAITSILFVPMDGYLVTDIRDEKELVWTPKWQEYCARVVLHIPLNGDSLMHITTRTNGEYFFVHKTTWENITKVEFDAFFDKAKIVDVDLDLSTKVNKNRFHLFDASVGDKKLVTVVPKEGYRIKKVVHGTTNVWDKPQDQTCTCVTFSSSPRNTTVRLTILDAKMGTIRYTKHIVIENVHDEELKSLEYPERLALEYPHPSAFETLNVQHAIERSYRKVSGIVLDLNMDVSDNHVDVVDTAVTGKPFILFNSVSNTPVTSVVDGDFTIWRSINGAHCISASTLMVNGKPSLVELFIKDETSVSRAHFAKLYYNWVNVNEKSFTESVERLTAEEKTVEVKEDSFTAAPLMATLVFLFFALSA